MLKDMNTHPAAGKNLAAPLFLSADRGPRQS
jgi:hypothetical protein